MLICVKNCAVSVAGYVIEYANLALVCQYIDEYRMLSSKQLVS